ncbi:MAG: methyltransferase family protein [Promethearchaeota archaeon]
MSISWTIRLTLIGLLFILVIIFGKFLKNRERYSFILENVSINLVSVILFNAFCYTSMILPPDGTVLQKPPFLSLTLNTRWYDILGLILMIFGVLILIRTVLMRKALGAQDTSGKLLTKGIYSFSRHPIYLGIIIVSLGLGLRTINIDALLIYPLIVLANYIQSKLEEVYDVGVRFKQEYSEYKKQTRRFGPIWFWGIILITLILPLILSIIILSL